MFRGTKGEFVFFYPPKNYVVLLSISREFGHTHLMLKTTPKQPGEAHLRYLDADLHVLTPGDFVMCAVTGRKIPLAALRYWSVDRQEAYADAAAALKAEQDAEAQV